jgi:hypothetical protein
MLSAGPIPVLTSMFCMNQKSNDPNFEWQIALLDKSETNHKQDFEKLYVFCVFFLTLAS